MTSPEPGEANHTSDENSVEAAELIDEMTMLYAREVQQSAAKTVVIRKLSAAVEELKRELVQLQGSRGAQEDS